MSRNCEDCSIDGECLLQRTGTLSCNIGSDKRPEHRVKDLDAEVNALVQQLHDIANGYAFYNAPDKSKTIMETWKFLEKGLEKESQEIKLLDETMKTLQERGLSAVDILNLQLGKITINQLRIKYGLAPIIDQPKEMTRESAEEYLIKRTQDQKDGFQPEIVIINGLAFDANKEKEKIKETYRKTHEITLRREEMKKKENNNGLILTLGPKPLYKALIKYTGDKDAQLMFFDIPVHIAYSILTTQVGIYDEKGNCLYLAHWDKVEYCQIVTDAPIEPRFLSKHMNIPVDPSMGGKVVDTTATPSCLGCAYDGPTHCESPSICKKSGNQLPGYISKER